VTFHFHMRSAGGPPLRMRLSDSSASTACLGSGAELGPLVAYFFAEVSARYSTWRISRPARTQLIILLAMLDGALCVPLLALAAISKYQVPAASPTIVYVVAVGLVIVID